MCPPEAISDAVYAFIRERIDTVPQLESLLLLWEDSDRAWSPDELATRIYVAPDVAAQILQALHRRQLVHRTDESELRYQYDRSWDGSERRMVEIAEAYRRNTVQLATFIHAGASTSVREFARAFELKKDP